MKKILLTLILIFLSLFLFGCNEVIDLTDTENEYIAEYAAGLILKYGGYNKDFYSDSDKEETITTTQEITTEDSDVITEEVTTENDNILDNEGTMDSNNTTESAEDDSEVVDANQFDIAELISNKDFSIKYIEYHILQEYPSYDNDGVFLVIDAPPGYKLLILKFRITNLTREEQSLNLYEKDIKYSITINDNKSAKAMLTILMDDLYTYSGDIPVDGSFDAVLLFQVSDEIANKINSASLNIKYNDDEATLIIK